MSPNPDRHEIDHHTLKFIVGFIACSLAFFTELFALTKITSISASYHEGGWSQSFFVGFLFAIAAFLAAYNGYSFLEMILSKIASIAALGVALFPCGCEGYVEIIPHVHAGSAVVMFSILLCFCYFFYRRARAKGHTQAKRRAAFYALCGIAIGASMVAIGIDFILGGRISAKIPRLVFYCERTGLVAFGISWLTASCTFPLLTSKHERFPLFSIGASK